MNRLTAIGLASLVAWGVLIATKYAGFAPASAGDRAPARVAATEGKATVGESAVLPVAAEPRAAVWMRLVEAIETAARGSAATGSTADSPSVALPSWEAARAGARSPAEAGANPAYLVAINTPQATREARPMAVRRFMDRESRRKNPFRQWLGPYS